MMKYGLHRSGKDEPFLLVEADSEDAIPTSVEKGSDSPFAGSVFGYAQRLAKRGSANAIAGRMGQGVAVVPVEDGGDEDESDLSKMIAKARQRIAETEDDEIDLKASGEIVKTDPAKQHVFGWAYVAIDKSGEINYDKSGDFVDQVEEIEKSAYDFVLNSRSADADHTNVKGGTLIESIVFTPEKIEKMGLEQGSVPLGWWLGFHIEDKATWARVEKGELRAFSIHGSGTRSKVEAD